MSFDHRVETILWRLQAHFGPAQAPPRARLFRRRFAGEAELAEILLAAPSWRSISPRVLRDDPFLFLASDAATPYVLAAYLYAATLHLKELSQGYDGLLIWLTLRDAPGPSEHAERLSQFGSLDENQRGTVRAWLEHRAAVDGCDRRPGEALASHWERWR